MDVGHPDFWTIVSPPLAFVKMHVLSFVWSYYLCKQNHLKGNLYLFHFSISSWNKQSFPALKWALILIVIWFRDMILQFSYIVHCARGSVFPTKVHQRIFWLMYINQTLPLIWMNHLAFHVHFSSTEFDQIFTLRTPIWATEQSTWRHFWICRWLMKV